MSVLPGQRLALLEKSLVVASGNQYDVLVPTSNITEKPYRVAVSTVEDGKFSVVVSKTVGDKVSRVTFVFHQSIDPVTPVYYILNSAEDEATLPYKVTQTGMKTLVKMVVNININDGLGVRCVIVFEFELDIVGGIADINTFKEIINFQFPVALNDFESFDEREDDEQPLPPRRYDLIPPRNSPGLLVNGKEAISIYPNFLGGRPYTLTITPLQLGPDPFFAFFSVNVFKNDGPYVSFDFHQNRDPNISIFGLVDKGRRGEVTAKKALITPTFVDFLVQWLDPNFEVFVELSFRLMKTDGAPDIFKYGGLRTFRMDVVTASYNSTTDPRPSPPWYDAVGVTESVVSTSVITDMWGNDLGEVWSNVVADSEYKKQSYPQRLVGKCQQVELPDVPPGKHLSIFSFKPKVKKVLLGHGSTLLEQTSSINTSGDTDCKFFSRILQYSAVRFIFSGLLFGDFKVKYLERQYEDRFIAALATSPEFRHYLKFFVDPVYGLTGLAKYYKCEEIPLCPCVIDL